MTYYPLDHWSPFGRLRSLQSCSFIIRELSHKHNIAMSRKGTKTVWKLLEVIKRCLKPYEPLFLLSTNIDLVPLTPYHWQLCVSNFWNVRKGRLAKLIHRVKNMIFDNNRTLWCLFCKKLPICNIFCKIRKAIFDILQEILKSCSFFMSQKFKMQSCQCLGVKNRLNLFL